jgi:hypothetical protein
LIKKYFSQGSVARNTLLTSNVLLIRLFLQASTLVVLAKILGADSFGIFAGLSAAAVLAGSLSTFGMHFTLLRASSREESEGKKVSEYALWTTLSAGLRRKLPYSFSTGNSGNRNPAIHPTIMHGVSGKKSNS